MVHMYSPVHKAWRIFQLLCKQGSRLSQSEAVFCDGTVSHKVYRMANIFGSY